MMRHIARFGFLLSLLLWLMLPVLAQTGNAQICIRSFEDRNNNGLFDPGEPLITRGIGLSLSNADGIIIETALLESSPQAAQGIVCFQRLVAGQYTVDISSADYEATGADAFVVTLDDSSLPQVEDFGAQVIVSTMPEAVAEDPLSEAAVRVLLERLFFSGIGAVLVISLMVMLGTLIYFIVVRPRQRVAYATGQMRPVTGQMPVVNPTTGQMDAVNPTTGQMRAVTPGPGMHPVTPPSTGNMPPIPPPDDDDTNGPFKPPAF